MIIAQITDLHAAAKDRLCYRKVPTNEQLAQSITHINSLNPLLRPRRGCLCSLHALGSAIPTSLRWPAVVQLREGPIGRD